MSKKTNAYKNYPPGSDEAREKDCLCSSSENGYGKGIMGGTLTDDEGNPLYWIHRECPLHGEDNGQR